MKIEKVSIKEKLKCFEDYWNPRIVGELNNQCVKIAKFKGMFTWHKHDNEDELFYVINGTLIIEFRDKTIEIKKDEFIIVPRGIEHRPIAENEVSVMLFEPKSTLNTGNKNNKFTRKNIEPI